MGKGHYGMTPNMMAIVRINRLAREEPWISYGRFTAQREEAIHIALSGRKKKTKPGRRKA